MAEPEEIAPQEAASSTAGPRTPKRKSKRHADANARHTDQQTGGGLTLVITTDLRTDGGTQPREQLDDAVVRRYAEDMEAGLWDFTKSSAPITAFYDGESYWVGDGGHRVAAAKKARLDELQVDVREGSQRDAILYSVGANATHGYPRSNEDKRRAVSRLLEDPEWSKWSDREIARRCYVNHHLASRLRSVTGSVPSERTYKTKHGSTAMMNTGAIGGKPKPPTSAPPAAQLEVGSVETERAGVGDVIDLGEAPQAADDAKPDAEALDTGYNSGTQQLLKRHLSQNDWLCS